MVRGSGNWFSSSLKSNDVGELDEDEDDDITFSDVDDDSSQSDENDTLDQKTKRPNGEKFPNGARRPSKD